MKPWSYSKYLLQASPPDMADPGQRWTFAIYEILDKRLTPIDPRIIHATYRGFVELEPSEIPDVNDPTFSAKLEERVISEWKGDWTPKQKQVVQRDEAAQ